MGKDVKLKYVISQASVILTGGVQIGIYIYIYKYNILNLRSFIHVGLCTVSGMHNIDFLTNDSSYRESMSYMITLIAVLSLGAVFGSLFAGLLVTMNP